MFVTGGFCVSLNNKPSAEGAAEYKGLVTVSSLVDMCDPCFKSVIPGYILTASSYA